MNGWGSRWIWNLTWSEKYNQLEKLENFAASCMSATSFCKPNSHSEIKALKVKSSARPNRTHPLTTLGLFIQLTCSFSWWRGSQNLISIIHGAKKLTLILAQQFWFLPPTALLHFCIGRNSLQSSLFTDCSSLTVLQTSAFSLQLSPFQKEKY